MKTRIGELSEEALKPAPLLTGRALIERGYKPGPAFSEMLRVVEDAQLEGSLQSAADALRLVENRYPRGLQ